MEEFTQCAAESIGMKGTRGGEFGGGLQNAGHDHGQDQIALAGGMPIDEPVEMQFAQSAEDGGDMAMRAGADNVEGLRERSTNGSGAL